MAQLVLYFPDSLELPSPQAFLVDPLAAPYLLAVLQGLRDEAMLEPFATVEASAIPPE